MTIEWSEISSSFVFFNDIDDEFFNQSRIWHFLRLFSEAIKCDEFHEKGFTTVTKIIDSCHGLPEKDKLSFSCRINSKCFPDSRKSYVTEVQPATTTTTLNTIRYVCNVNFTSNIMVAGHNSHAKIGVLQYNTRIKPTTTTGLKTIILMVEESGGSGSVI